MYSEHESDTYRHAQTRMCERSLLWPAVRPAAVQRPSVDALWLPQSLHWPTTMRQLETADEQLPNWFIQSKQPSKSVRLSCPYLQHPGIAGAGRDYRAASGDIAVAVAGCAVRVAL